MSIELEALIERAMQIREQYSALETSRYQRAWTRQDVAMGFVGDVGDLMKLVMAQEGIRAISDASEKLAHELADCLWSVLVLARLYEIDLESAFLKTMDEIEQLLKRD